MTDETRSLSGVRIDDRGRGRYVGIPLRVQETGSGTDDANARIEELSQQVAGLDFRVKMDRD